MSESTKIAPAAVRRIGPYEVGRELGQGGMGTVYLAVRADDQYRKLVAIKLVNRGMDTELILRRFTRERQILAHLEHENIARMLEGGSTADGLPYFVMEYIEGEPIGEYCDAKKYSTASRLELFRKVCAALHYAHQNLVVHCDIKPSNILVTADGTPKLLDFGIAKLLSPDGTSNATETSVIGKMLTTAYASPEQLRGGPITTASDVYSLSIIFYELLTGHRPYDVANQRAEEVAQIIARSEVVKPSVMITRPLETSRTQSNKTETTPQFIGEVRDGSIEKLRRNLAGDLDNIVLKALRSEPERRYASALELSEDIRRHLEGLPVTASPDTFTYRARKLIKRNKAVAIASAVILLTLITATGLTAWQARVARRERDKAEFRFAQVRRLANSVLFEYHDGIENLPGSTPMRERMVRDASEYLDNLSAEGSGDPALQRELATAYEKVGDAQGSPFRSNLGNFNGALISHRKALAIRESLAKGPAADEQLKLELARSYSAIGELLHVTGNLPSALDHYGKAFGVFASVNTKTAEIRREESILDVRYGKSLRATGKLNEAVASFQKGIAVADALSAANKDDHRLVRAAALARIFLGDAYTDLGQLKEALATEQKAFALLEPLVSEIDAQSRRDLAVAYAREADVMAKMGDKTGALEIELKALKEDENAVNVDPTNALARRDLYIDYYKAAFMQEGGGDMKSALANQRHCISLVEAEVSSNPDSAEAHSDLSVAYFRFAEMLEKENNLPGALENYRKALAIVEVMTAADPANTGSQGDQSEDLMKVADITLKLGNGPEALTDYLRALEIRERLVAANRDDVEGQMQLARLYDSLGLYSFLLARNAGRVADWEEAKRRYQQSSDAWVDLKNKGNLPEEYSKRPAESLRQLAACNAALGRISRHQRS